MILHLPTSFSFARWWRSLPHNARRSEDFIPPLCFVFNPFKEGRERDVFYAGGLEDEHWEFLIEEYAKDQPKIAEEFSAHTCLICKYVLDVVDMNETKMKRIIWKRRLLKMAEKFEKEMAMC